MKGDCDMARLFGTDGIRGIAGKELTRSLAAGIGEKLTLILSRSGEKPKILLARDTRPSGQMLCLAIASGICSAGGDVLFADILPTPAVAFLTVHLGASAGIMVTASHNPSEYNGIKIFGGDGHKLCDELEDKIEAMLSRQSQNMPLCDTGEITILDGAGEYISHLVSAAPSDLSGLHIAVDCACGSACVTAEKIFSSLGAQCDMLFDKPDGANINSGCGSTDVSYLSEYVRKNGLCGGAAFDGDADRCICVDETGNPIDGDSMLAALALDMKQSGKLHGGIVGTVMSNCGLIRFCDENGIRFLQTKVGDRYVSAIMLFSLVRRTGKTLSELASVIKKMPQLSRNIPATAEQKIAFLASGDVKRYLDEVRERLGKSGRLVARPSGTEPCIRLTAECGDETLLPVLLDTAARKISALIKNDSKEDICAE